uniref:Uncharacterized protein n=1 Tax=Spongospora subterranea TaxID=70186 RepID=A0A0H5QZN6_9EUKA|eukprot:CRZ07168.1 hypothetical protein [Spongospora subterranea]
MPRLRSRKRTAAAVAARRRQGNLLVETNQEHESMHLVEDVCSSDSHTSASEGSSQSSLTETTSDETDKGNEHEEVDRPAIRPLGQIVLKRDTQETVNAQFAEEKLNGERIFP